MEVELHLPDDFEATMWDAKGYFPNAKLTVGTTTYILNFYDPSRLAQEIAEATKSMGFFHEPNLVVVSQVNRTQLQQAVRKLAESNGLRQLSRLNG